jgi:hypothetical protein
MCPIPRRFLVTQLQNTSSSLLSLELLRVGALEIHGQGRQGVMVVCMAVKRVFVSNETCRHRHPQWAGQNPENTQARKV